MQVRLRHRPLLLHRFLAAEEVHARGSASKVDVRAWVRHTGLLTHPEGAMAIMKKNTDAMDEATQVVKHTRALGVAEKSGLVLTESGRALTVFGDVGAGFGEWADDHNTTCDKPGSA